MNIKIKFYTFFTIALISTVMLFQACTPEEVDEILKILVEKTGWLEEQEQMDDIPEDITPFPDGSETLKSVVSLDDKFPPIGNQEKYGTCVVWSVGYNLKTALNAIEKGWSKSDLANTSNQTSPKDLWMSIPSDKKNGNCEGTNFEPALDALISSGVASFSAVPYTNLGSCDGQKVGNSNNKLANYRKIASDKEGLTVNNFKGYLNSGRPVAIGARLGDRFMSWNSSAVISSDTYNDQGMQHAYHAMVISGYDDSKRAFRVRNSWGPTWGDKGSIWVDYDFFCRSFCFAAFVAQNEGSVTVGNGEINTGDLSSGYDLLAYHGYDIDDDEETDPLLRKFSYNVYNSGTQTILPSQKWTVVYMYYNAADANDYEIIFDDYYTIEYGTGNDENPYSTSLAGGWWNNASVLSGKKAGETEFPKGFEITYKMPQITGKYYLVVMADAYDKISEANEDNNFYFITAEGGKPLEFTNGIVSNMSAISKARMAKSKQPARFSNTETQTAVKPGNLNTYTPTELKIMLVNDKKSEKIDAKIKSYRAQKGSETKRAVKK